MPWLVALALQALPPDSVLDALSRAEPIRFEQVGGLPGWAQVVAYIAAIVSGVAAAIAAYASWQSVKATRTANTDQRSWRTQEQTDQATRRAEEQEAQAARREEDQAVQAARREEQREWRRIEREYVYYNAIVARPMLDAVQTYGQQFRRVLAEGTVAVRSMHDAGASTQEVKDAVTTLLSETFAAEHGSMTQALTEAAEAWPEKDLREAISVAAEKASEGVAGEGALLLDPDGQPNFDAILNETLGALRRVVMDHDPAIKAVAVPTA